MSALHAKRCWAFIKGDSVWSHYMKRKYGDPSIPNYVIPHSPSPLWRSMLKIFPSVFNNCQWVIGRDNIPVWGVNWSGNIIPKPHADAVSLLKEVEISNLPDRSCWCLTNDGEFTTKSYREHFRTRYPTFIWSEFYWNRYIPPRIGAFLWKLSRKAVAVDARLTRMGFHLASKCVCCSNPEEETIDHLFVGSETASAIWSHFAAEFHLVNTPTSLDHLTLLWLQDISLKDPIGISRNIVFCNCLWEIWKFRNSIIFDNGAPKRPDIIGRVSSALQHTMRVFRLDMDREQKDTGAIDRLQPASKTRGSSHSWAHSRQGLNLSISSHKGSDSSTSSGGIIRDSNGNMILGFNTYCTNGSSSIPEFDILLRGLLLGKTNNIRINTIDSTSSSLINILSGRQITPWRLAYKVRKFHSLLPHFSGFSKVSVGSISVAKALASLASLSKEDQIFSHTSELPDDIRQAITADQSMA